MRANGGSGIVRIGPMTWPQVIQTLSRYEIIDICVEGFVRQPGYISWDDEDDVYLSAEHYLGRIAYPESVLQRIGSIRTTDIMTSLRAMQNLIKKI